MKGKIYFVAALVAAIVVAATGLPSRPVPQHEPVARMPGTDAALLLAAQKLPTPGSTPTSAEIPLAAAVSPETRARVNGTYGKLPLHFEANTGQTDEQVKFLARSGGYTMFLTPTEAVLTLRPVRTEADTPLPSPLPQGERESKRDRTVRNRGSASSPSPLAGEGGGEGENNHEAAVLRLQWKDANPNPRIAGAEPLPGKSAYFHGNDPAQWRTDVPHYSKVRYEAVYPGIDLVYYGNQRQIEYDFVVSPGADPTQIRLAIQGAEDIRLDAKGNLVLATAQGELLQKAPIIYQEIEGTRVPIEGRYVLHANNEVGFQVAAYDVERTLVIDPIIQYATYLGGTGDDRGHAIAVDAGGNAYVVGSTASAAFPTTPGAYDVVANGGNDAFVTKLSPDGSTLVYSTFVGGTGDDLGYAIAVDTSGNAVVIGVTNGGFPTLNAAQPSYGGGVYDAFLFKLDPTGTALVYSTYVGGSSYEVTTSSGGLYSVGIAVDALGAAYITGWTASTNFPTTPGAYRTTPPAGIKAFVAKFDTNGTRVYSTYLASGSAGNGIAVDSAGNAYVTGTVYSFSFPTTPGAFDTTMNDGVVNTAADVFVTKLNPTGSALVYSTYLGGNGDEGTTSTTQGYQSIAVDASGNAYVAGWTNSTDFPVTAGAYQTTKSTSYDAFVTKFDPSGNALVYSTYLGGTGQDGSGKVYIALDAAGSAYVHGLTNGGFPTVNAPQPTYGGGTTDSFVVKLTPAGDGVEFATYVGGSGGETSGGIAVDTNGNAYIAGITGSSTGLARGTAYDSTFGGVIDAFVAKIEALFPNINVTPTTVPFGSVGVGGTANQTVTVANNGTANLTLGTITAPAAPFSRTGGSCTNGQVLAATGSCTIILQFAPTAAGAASGSFNVPSDDPDAGTANGQNNVLVDLSGTGTAAPNINVTPTTVPFGSVGVGGTANQTVTVANNGTANLTLGTITAPAAPFSRTGGSCTNGQVLAPAATCTIDLQFAPSAAGAASGSFNVPSDDPDAGTANGQNNVLVDLSGTGTAAPNINVTPTTVPFGSVGVGGTANQTVTVANNGTANLTLGTITAPAAPFSRTGGSCTNGQVLAPAATCTIDLQFAPSAAGAASGSFNVPSDDPDAGTANGQNNVLVDLSGTGTAAPNINVTPTTVPFGSVGVGGTANQTVTVANSGTANLTLGTITNPAAPFSRTGGTCTNGQVLAATGSCTIILQFAPTAAGAASGSFNVPSDDPDAGTGNGQNNVLVSVSGTGTAAPNINVTPTTVPFGSVGVGGTANQTVTVANSGTANLTLGTITNPAAPFSRTGGTCTNGQVLAATGSCTIILQFAPTAAGAASGSFNVPSDDPDAGTGNGQNNVLVSLNGTGVACLTAISVNSTADAVDTAPGNGSCADGSGFCTLRAAVQEANACPANATITVPAGTYTLTLAGSGETASATGDLNITTNLTIQGAGAANTIIDGNGLDRVFRVTSGAGAITVAMLDVSVRGGNPGAASFGGGISNENGILSLTRCVVGPNSAPSGLGGGIFNSRTVTLTESTVSGNSAGSGGGIHNFVSAFLTLTNSTVSGNTATVNGGGIVNFDSDANLYLYNSTVASNTAASGGGVDDAGVFFARHSIVANNTGGNCVGTVNSQGWNLASDASCAFAGTGDQNGTPPLLGPLANNGGPTFTHALLAGSPAIDAGDNMTCPMTDQRGIARPIDGNAVAGAICDIGAYEAAALGVADLVLTKTDSPDPLTVGATLTYTLTVTNNGPDPATGIVLTDTLPVGVTFGTVTPGGPTCTQAAGVVTCGLGTLANAASTVVTITVTPTAAGTITNSASAAHPNEIDPNAANNTNIQATTTVNPVAASAPNVNVTPLPVAFVATPLGGFATREVLVENTGVANLMLGAIVPPAAPFSRTGGTCVNGQTLVPGASCTISVRFTPTALGAAAGGFDVPSNDPDPGTANNQNNVLVVLTGTGTAAAPPGPPPPPSPPPPGPTPPPGGGPAPPPGNPTPPGGPTPPPSLSNPPLWPFTVPAASGEALVADDSGVVVAGYASNGGTFDLLLARFATDGTKQWERRLDLGGHEFGYGLAQDSLGRLTVVGYSQIGVLAGMLVAQYDANGTLLWQKVIPGDFAAGYAVVAGPDDSLYVTGERWNGINTDLWLLKLSSAGDVQWNTVRNEGGDEIGYGLALTATGLYAVGSKNTTLWGCLFTLGGAVQGCATGGPGIAYQVAVEPASNDLYLGGLLEGATRNAFVARFNPASGFVWLGQFDGGQEDLVRGMVLGKNGFVYATGRTGEGGNADLGGVAINGLGQPGGLHRYNGGGFDAGHAVAVDPQGRAYVTGVTSVGGVDSLLLLRLPGGPP